MFRSLGRIATVLALCASIGLHWIALQSVAWTTMLVENSQHAPLRQAIVQTFDGAHPCTLCHAVNAGRQSEKKSNAQLFTLKIDLICLARSFHLLPPFVPYEYSTGNFLSAIFAQLPPVPPPRATPS